MNRRKTKATRIKNQVLIADDHLVVRLGLRALLDIHPRIKVMGEAATGSETLALVATTHPDVVLLDLRMPDVDGLEVCRRLKLGSPSPAVLFLTSYADDKRSSRPSRRARTVISSRRWPGRISRRRS